MARLRFCFFSLCVFCLLSGCGGSLGSQVDVRDRMLYAAGLNDAVIQAYDLEIDPDTEPGEGEFEDWPMYRYDTSGRIRQLFVAPNLRWIVGINEYGVLEPFQSRVSGRLMRKPKVYAPEGEIQALAISPDSNHLYATSTSGNIYSYHMRVEGAAEPVGEPVSGPTSASKAIFHPSGEYLYIMDSEGSRIWQYAVDASGVLTPLPSASISVSGGPSDGLWNTDGSRFYVSCTSTNQVVQLGISGGSLQEQSRVAGPARLSAPVISPDGAYLIVASREGDGELWRYQIGASLTPLDPPFPTNHEDQGGAILNPFDLVFVLNVGDRNYSEYRVNPDGSILYRRTKGLDFSAGVAVFRINP